MEQQTATPAETGQAQTEVRARPVPQASGPKPPQEPQPQGFNVVDHTIGVLSILLTKDAIAAANQAQLTGRAEPIQQFYEREAKRLAPRQMPAVGDLVQFEDGEQSAQARVVEVLPERGVCSLNGGFGLRTIEALQVVETAEQTKANRKQRRAAAAGKKAPAKKKRATKKKAAKRGK